jgi:hypothetical protein
MIRASCFWRGCVVGVLLTYGAAGAQVCPHDGASNDALIAFLRTARAANAAELCVVSAIKQLQYVHSQEAIDVLVRYLDFRRDLGREIQTGSNSEAYPAISSLFAIGKSSLPSLILVVAGNGFTKTAQDNAIRTIMIIHRDHPAEGIRLMMREARDSQDAERKALFRQAAISALRWCLGRDQKECESVLSDASRP